MEKVKEDLEKELRKAVKEHKFSFLEITGFKTDPNLALLAGAAIGYQLAITWVQTLMKEKELI